MPKWPHIRVLLIASEARPADVKEALEAGAHGMLVRCDSLQVLRDAISVISSGQPYFCQNSTRLLVEAVRQAKFAKFDALTAREREILVRIARSETPKEIALRLGTCSKTVSNQLCALREKLGIRDVPGLVRYAIREGLVRATD
ncbi:transcriptional activator protein ExaE [mine drainage metagenome]|uniref:Transcriptional activator protein ExaE n=1 Tax=mine drainage metagenome TaxID=410659 RepID=A0A1J5QBA3_9ZZZZ